MSERLSCCLECAPSMNGRSARISVTPGIIPLRTSAHLCQSGLAATPAIRGRPFSQVGSSETLHNSDPTVERPPPHTSATGAPSMNSLELAATCDSLTVVSLPEAFIRCMIIFLDRFESPLPRGVHIRGCCRQIRQERDLYTLFSDLTIGFQSSQ